MSQRSFAKTALTLIFVLYSAFYFKKNLSHRKNYLAHLEILKVSLGMIPPNRVATSILQELGSYEGFMLPCPKHFFFIPEKMDPNLAMLNQISLYSFTPCSYQIREKLPEIAPEQSIALVYHSSLPNKNNFKILKTTSQYTLIQF
jgi:hypothetical protein